MALKNYKSKGDIASPTMAPITFSRKRHGGNRSGETEIASGLPADVDIDLKEVYFLIMHFLSLGPCQRTYAQIWNELLEHELLPRRYHAWYSRKGAPSGDENDNGYSLPLSYSSLVDRYPHIERDHLVKLFKQLILCCSPPLNGIAGGNPPNAADVPTLLGSGSFSLLESHKDRELKRVRCSSQYLRWPHVHADQVHGLSLREIGGGFTKHHRAPSIRAACHAIAKPETIMQKMQVIKKLRGHQNAVYCAIFDRSGRYLITGSDDRLVKIWSLETAFCLSSCRGHEGDITDLAVSANNALVASASNDFVIRVWRLPDGLPISVLRGHTGVVTAIVFSPRPSSAYHLLSSSDDGTCRIWDSRSSQTCPRVYIPKPSDSGHGNPNPNASQPQPNRQILCCAFNSNGTVFVTGSADTYARVFNACRSITEDSEPPTHEIDLLSGHENDVNYVQFSGCAVTSKFSINDSSKEDNLPRFKNSWFNLDNIVTCSRDGSAIIWTPRSRRSHGKSGRWIRAYHLKVPPPPVPLQPARGGPRQRLQPTPRGVNMIVWSLDNHFVLAAIMDCRICVWNASDGSLVHSLLGHNESTFVLDVHPFDPRIAMTAGYDGKVIVWDIWKGAAVREYETGHFKLVDGRFSPDGTSVVVSDEVGQIFIIGTGQGESQKDAKYDQFFLGDYRPLIRDTQGNVLDQESQLPPYRRNIQDQLCDASMIPYPEPYQSTYQRRRLSAVGMEWRPPSVKFAVGPSSIAGDYQILPFPDLDRWVEPIPEFLDAMEWEENEVQSDDADSEYNVTEECSTEDEQGSVGSSPESSECSAEESEAGDENVDGLRRSKRKKVKSEVELTTSSGRRVKRRNLDGNDDPVAKSTKKRKRKKGRLTSKKKTSKPKPHRPQRRAARNALTFLSQIGEASTDGEDEDDSESCSSDNSAVPDSNTPSNESDRSMSNYNSNNAHGKENTTDEAADVTKPVVISDPQAGAGNRRRLVLKLSIRDAKKGTPVKHQNGSLDECKDIVELEVNKSPISDQKQSWDPGQTSEGRVGTIVSTDEIGSSSSEYSEKPEDQPGISAVHQSAKIRWGEVKLRSAKRFRVNDGSVADAWPAADSNFGNHDHLASNSNGCLEHEAVSPHSQIHTFEDNGSFTRKLVNNHLAGYVSEMVNAQNSSSCINKKPPVSDQQYPIVSASNEKNITMVTYNEGKNKYRQQAGNGFESSLMIKDNGKNESEGAHAQHNPILDHNGRHMSGQSDGAGSSNQHVYRRLKFTSKKTLGESSTSYSRSTPSREHRISDDLVPGSSSYAERDPLSVVHEEDAGSTGESDYGDWTNGSARLSNGRSPKRESIRLKISRGGNSEEVTDSVPDYENPRTNSFRRTRSHGSKAMASESNSLLRSCRFRESYDYAEASKSGFRFSLRNGQPRTDEKLNSKATVGLRSTRNRRENYDVDDLYTLDKRKGQNPVKKLSWLMLSEHEECYRYIPQLGDEVAYLRQGHEEYLKNIRSSESGPWKFVGQDLRAVEFCKVENLDYATLPGSGESCCKLTLVFTDPSSGGYGKGFKLTLPELVEFPDFLVERTRYDSAIERNWTYRDKCQVWWRNDGGDSGSWWEGRILSIKPKSQAFPDSPWENIIIQYKNDSSDQHLHCPWELHDVGTHWEHPCIDDATKKKLLATIIKIEKTSQRSRDTCGLEKLSQVSQKSDFLNRFPVPLSLELVERRLENDYYRTVDAVKHDLRVTISNAQAYFSKSVEHAAKMRKLSDLISGAFDL